MKAFTLSIDQISRVVGAACADELSRRFGRHFDFLTIAGWTGETTFGSDGLSLNDEEKAACAERCASFFDLDPSQLGGPDTEKISDWSNTLKSALEEKLTAFTFKSAARDDTESLCRHSADSIYQDAGAVSNILFGRRRLLSFVAPHSLIGFALTILMPNLQGIESVDVRGMTPEQLTHTLSYGDVLIATPTLWQYIMRENLKAPDNTMAVSFGEPMTPALTAQMRQAGFAALRELYGSTENGLIGWRDAPTEDFVLFDHWRVEGDQLLRVLPSTMTSPVEAMDFMEWTGPRSFQLAGRRDGAIQIGAVNVSPDDVAKRLSKHEMIADCMMSVGAREGAKQLIAHIVLKKGILPDERTAREIDVWCKQTLRQQERPRIYHFERVLPMADGAAS